MYRSLPSPSSAVNWAGFYVLDRANPSASVSPLSAKTLRQRKPVRQLILGPFMGKVACQTILFGKGVCGTAAETRQVQLVRDVEVFPGHIACDGDSKSEIVVPVVVKEEVSPSSPTLQYRTGDFLAVASELCLNVAN